MTGKPALYFNKKRAYITDENIGLDVISNRFRISAIAERGKDHPNTPSMASLRVTKNERSGNRVSNDIPTTFPHVKPENLVPPRCSRIDLPRCHWQVATNIERRTKREFGLAIPSLLC